ncbi:uncharacterized protein LOC129574801 [Sitodiplosis mosellana]|uniref:uncharacterized protein LOC129574801 n=1 Tax=Sitodiplosis mosellana TaxID=263140 RepID=UPI002443F431|nr:uncharacterized protein LOC129574801 [Sitodiplosis mosellana]
MGRLRHQEMRKELKKFKVYIQQISSPAEFWLQIPSPHGLANLCAAQNQNVHRKTVTKDHNQYLVRDNETVFAWKCHLAFIAPTNSHTTTAWSLSANDKFIEYTKRFDELAISIPCLSSATSISTAVILWGLRQHRMNALDATEDDWENLNLMLIFQGVARSITDIEIIQHLARVPQDFVAYPSVQLTDDKIVQFENHTRYSNRKWQPVEPSTTKEFVGMPVFIDNQMMIFVQESHHQKRIAEMTYEIKKKYSKREKRLITNWRRGEMCIADGTYYRAEIRTVFPREQSCLVYFVDFGVEDTIDFKDLWRCTLFKNVPIQVRKCHVQKIKLPSKKGKICPSRAVHKFTIDMIRGKTCSFYIHDNLDSTRIDSIPCTVRPLNEPLDLASELVSYHMVGITSDFKRTDKFDEEKRKRTECDDKVLMPSTELESFDDFKWFYERKKAVIPLRKSTDSAEDNRKFEVFDHSRQMEEPREKNKTVTIVEKQIESQPHPLVDKITKHFHLSTPKELAFYCQPLFVIDPITILVVPINAAPRFIDMDTKPTNNPLLPENAPCIALLDKKWHRGIVWEQLSTDEYTILCADTLKLIEVKRDFVQVCPPDLLHTKLECMKVRFSEMMSHPRLRSQDLCHQLSKALLDKKLCLFVRIVRVHSDEVPEIKLNLNEHSKKSICTELVDQKYYKQLKR